MVFKKEYLFIFVIAGLAVFYGFLTLINFLIRGRSKKIFTKKLALGTMIVVLTTIINTGTFAQNLDANTAPEAKIVKDRIAVPAYGVPVPKPGPIRTNRPMPKYGIPTPTPPLMKYGGPFPTPEPWPTMHPWPTVAPWPTVEPWPTNQPWPTVLPWPTLKPKRTRKPWRTKRPKPTPTRKPIPIRPLYGVPLTGLNNDS